MTDEYHQLNKDEYLHFDTNSPLVCRKHTNHFAHFCRLSNWFTFCGSPGYEDIPWKYEFELGFYRDDGDYYSIPKFFKDCLAVYLLPCVQSIKLDRIRKMAMKKEALNMLDQLNTRFTVEGLLWTTTAEREEWAKNVTRLRKFLNKW